MFCWDFGMPMPGRNANSGDYRFGFQGEEQDNEVKGNGNHINFTFRGYDPRIGRMWSVDPLAEKYPSMSPYSFGANNPIFYVDPDGREPIPWYRRWFGAERKAWQWYSTGVSDRISNWDSKTFHSAALYSTNNSRASAYQTVYQRNAYYGWVQEQADAKGYNSKWFGAADLVTRWNGVGGVDLMNLAFMHDNTESFLRGGNEFLFGHNIKNAKGLLANGSLSGGFTDANGASQSFEGLTGIALDNKLVEFEQSKVQEYINNYKGNDLNDIMSEINELMSSRVGPGDVKDVMKAHFDGGKSFNFGNYNDRVKLGQELIKLSHDE